MQYFHEICDFPEFHLCSVCVLWVLISCTRMPVLLYLSGLCSVCYILTRLLLLAFIFKLGLVFTKSEKGREILGGKKQQQLSLFFVRVS